MNRSSFVVMMHRKVCNDNNENAYSGVISEVPMTKLRFKALLQLYSGDNEIKFDFLGVKDTLRISFYPASNPYSMRLVYIVCCDDDGRFQCPPDQDNSQASAVKRLKVAGLVLQCCMAELLWSQKMGRKTFW